MSRPLVPALAAVVLSLAVPSVRAQEYDPFRVFYDRARPLPQPAGAPGVQVPASESLAPGDEARARALLRAEGLARRAWPGFGLFDQPILLSRKGGPAVLIGHTSPPAGFEKAAMEGASRPVYVLRGGMELDFTFVTDVDLGGVPTYGQRVLGEGEPSSSTVALAVHERFHVRQSAAFSEQVRPPYPLEAKESPENIAWAEIEQKLLSAALRDPSRARARLRAFQAVREHRYGRFGKDVASVERWEESTEGTAEYVELRVLDQLSPAKGVMKGDLVRRLGQAPSPESMDKWRAYATGASMGRLLDRIEPGWKARVERGEGPYDVLASGLGPIPEGEMKVLLDSVAREFGYGAALERAGKEAGRSREARRKAIERFEGQKGRRLKVTLRWVPGTRSYFSSRGDTHETGPYETLFEEVREYLFQNEAMRVKVRNRPLWLRAGSVEFFLPEEGKFLLDGKPWSPGGGPSSFRESSASSEGIEVSLKAGTLSLEGGALTLVPRP